MKQLYTVKKDILMGAFFSQEAATAFAAANGAEAEEASYIPAVERRFRSDGAYEEELWTMTWQTAEGQVSYWAVGDYGSAMADTFLAAGKDAKLLSAQGWYWADGGYIEPIEGAKHSPLFAEVLEHIDENNIDIVKAWIWAVSALGANTVEELLAREEDFFTADGEPLDLDTRIERVHNREVRDIYGQDCLDFEGLHYLSGLEVQFDRADKEEKLRLLVLWGVLMEHDMVFVYQCYKMLIEGKTPRYKWGR